jgi:pimeloyl-ACP methyl ester carboxylesterase
LVARALTIAASDGTRLAGEESGEGPPVVLLHGLTATRRYVVMGSRALERSGHRVVAYDARGHGRSDPAPRRDAYGYPHLSEDLLTVLDRLEIERAVIAGASMGAHTAVSFALEHTRRVAGLGLITPSYDAGDAPAVARSSSLGAPGAPAGAGLDTRGAVADGSPFAGWDALARGLREQGVEGFLSAYDFSSIPQRWRETLEKVIRQRLSEHEHPEAVADALEAVPRSRPFERIADLRRLAVPTVVIASRDEADPSHPLAVGERYAEAIPWARLVVEEPGPPLRSPIAWQGGQLSKVLAELASRAM